MGCFDFYGTICSEVIKYFYEAFKWPGKVCDFESLVIIQFYVCSLQNIVKYLTVTHITLITLRYSI